MTRTKETTTAKPRNFKLMGLNGPEMRRRREGAGIDVAEFAHQMFIRGYRPTHTEIQCRIEMEIRDRTIGFVAAAADILGCTIEDLLSFKEAS